MVRENQLFAKSLFPVVQRQENVKNHLEDEKSH